MFLIQRGSYGGGISADRQINTEEGSRFDSEAWADIECACKPLRAIRRFRWEAGH